MEQDSSKNLIILIERTRKEPYYCRIVKLQLNILSLFSPLLSLFELTPLS